jgi:hypothetical protein
MPKLPHSVELHDSQLAAIRTDAQRITLELRPAYVHRDGMGWRQNANIDMAGVDPAVSADLAPARVADGMLKTQRGPVHNLLILPLFERGHVHLRLELASGKVLEVTGTSIAVNLLGEPEFVEQYS